MKMRLLSGVLILVSLLLLGTAVLGQEAKVMVLPKEDLNELLPDSVFLDGEKPPVQKRNAVAARMEDGKLLLVALVDVSGFSSGYQDKYVGVLIAQGKLKIGDATIVPGLYGLGRKKSMMGESESQAFLLYDIGGNFVADIPAEFHEGLRPVTPIQLKTEAMGVARLYLGPYFVTVSSQ